MGLMQWMERECLSCNVVKKEKPDNFKMRLTQEGRITYHATCIACERKKKGYDTQSRRNAAHAAAVRERKQHGQSYEELLEEMEAVHGPSSKWPMMLHIELSGKLYRQGNVTRYLEEPEPVSPREPVRLSVDYGDPRFRPSRAAVEQLIGQRK
jgi:hypothetical protein